MLLIAGAACSHAQTSTTASTSTNTASTNALGKVPAVVTPTNSWKTTIAFGITVARGNTDTTLASASATTEHKWLKNALTLEADGLYGESKQPNEAKDTETAEVLHGFAQYNRTFENGFYGFGRIDGFHDGIADIKYRLTLAPGLGYFFVTNKIVDLSAEVGPGYIKEQLDGRTESFATLRIAQQFHYTLSAHAKVWETIEYLPQVDNFGNYIVNFETGIDAGLTKGNKLSLRTVVRDSYVNDPAAGRLRNDLKIIAALAYKF